MKSFQAIPVEKLVLFAIIILGSFYLFVFPFNSAPDESMHFISAYQNADAALGQTSDDVKSLAMRKADALMLDKYDWSPNRQTYEILDENLFRPLQDGDEAIIDVTRISGVPHPYIYLPQTLGILLGRALHANPEWLYLLGRIFNMIFYAVCIWASVKITPIGKGLFALVALYPMAMELAASMSSDIYSISLAFLAAAQYMRIVYSNNPAKTRDLILFLLTLALLGPPKVVFIPLMLLALLLPARCFYTRKAAVIFRIFVVIAGIAVTFIAVYVWMHRTDGGVPVVMPETSSSIYTINQLLADPLMFAKTCYRSILSFFEYYLNSMIGAELGHIQISINKIAIEVFLALSVIAAFKEYATDRTLLIRDRIQFPIIFLVSALGTAIVMYVSWTPVGSWDILGIQGRYFIPVWPLFVLFAARWSRPVRPVWLNDRYLILAVSCLHVFVLISAYLFISGRGIAGS